MTLQPIQITMAQALAQGPVTTIELQEATLSPQMTDILLAGRRVAQAAMAGCRNVGTVTRKRRHAGGRCRFILAINGVLQTLHPTKGWAGAKKHGKRSNRT